MAYSATLAHMRGNLPDDDYKRILNLFSRAGLSMDHHQFNEDILEKGTQAILKTRDGKLRAAIPSPLGKCVFLNDVTQDELNQALRKHKEVMKSYPRQGEGIEAFVDASDTGYTMNQMPVEANGLSEDLKKLNFLNDDTKSNGVNGHSNGTNGHSNGVQANGAKESKYHASRPEGVNGTQGSMNGHVVNGNSHTNGNGVH